MVRDIDIVLTEVRRGQWRRTGARDADGKLRGWRDIGLTTRELELATLLSRKRVREALSELVRRGHVEHVVGQHRWIAAGHYRNESYPP